MKEIIIKIHKEAIWFNEQFSIPLKNSNFYDRSFRFIDAEIFWMVEQIRYNAEDSLLHVRVTDYHVTDTTAFKSQVPKRKINNFWFHGLKWRELSKVLIEADLNILKSLVSFDDYEIVLQNGDKWNRHSVQEGDSNYLSESIDNSNFQTESINKTQSIQVPQFINNTFHISFHEAHFRLGYIAFSKYIDQLNQVVDFKIPNDNILPEFDLIKFWFAKKLSAQEFVVKTEIEHINGEIKATRATSKTIGRIDSNLIEAIKYQRTYALQSPPKKPPVDKWLFTSEELFNEIDSEDSQGNIFNQSDAEILQALIEKTNVRNKKQLAYLAGKKQSDEQKLLFTLSPLFGFLFFIEGDRCNHFVWEMLDSHATYIWSIYKGDMDKSLQFKRIEDCINTVRSLGRTEYKNAYRHNHQDKDLVFNVINHDKITSDFVDGFVLWKSRINELLV